MVAQSCNRRRVYSYVFTDDVALDTSEVEVRVNQTELCHFYPGWSVHWG